MQPITPWRTTELTLVARREVPSAYLDIDVDVLFEGPGGATVRRQAFWDGGRIWRVRFAPPTSGTWQWSTSTRRERIPGLHGETGSVECVPRHDDLPIYRHGFLRVADSRRHLAHADGTPFFWLGDTHWRLLFESWDAANKDGWTSQFRGTVDRRARQGFSVYQTNLLSFSGGWDELKVGDAEAGVIDPEFFRAVVDPRMAYIAEAGLVNAAGIAWFRAILQEGAPERLERLARYLVARYGSYPIVWTLAGEVAGYEPAERVMLIEAWRSIALAIEECDGYGQLQTAHLTAERPIPSYYQGESWFDFTLNQHGHGDVDIDPAHYASHLAHYPDVPLVEGESMYEGLMSVEAVGRRTVTDAMLRQVAYRAIQSGCCGYTYGGQGCWNNAWDWGVGATHWGDLPWHVGVDLPGATQMGHLRRFYERHNWSALSPAPEVFFSPLWLNDVLYRPLASADSTRATVVVHFGETYRHAGHPAELRQLSASTYRLRWFDPRVGIYSMIGEAKVDASRTIRIPDKPDGRDWLLVAEALEPNASVRHIGENQER